jgi:hypothetical protein
MTHAHVPADDHGIPLSNDVTEHSTPFRFRRRSGSENSGAGSADEYGADAEAHQEQ